MSLGSFSIKQPSGYLTVTTDSILVQVSADLIFQTSWGTEEHIVAHTLGINVEIIMALLSLVGG